MRGVSVFCRHCGASIPDEAQFCPVCGESLEKRSGGAPGGNLDPVVPTAAQAEQEPPAPRRGGYGRAVLVGLIAALVIGAAAGGYLWARNDRERAAYEAVHGAHAVVIPLTSTSFDSNTGTRLPVHVTGTNADGAVDEVQFVNSDGTGLELARGTYQLDWPASPIGADGTLYAVPASGGTLAIGDDVQPGDPVTLQADQQLSVEAVQDPTQVTDEQMDAAKRYAAMDGSHQDGVDVAGITKKAEDRRNDAIAQKKAAEEQAAAEEAARKQAEEQAAQQAALKAQYHVETTYFTFDAPEYWYGRVRLEAHDGAIDVYSSTYPNRRICWIATSRNYLYTQPFGGNIGLDDDGEKEYGIFFDDYGEMISFYAEYGATGADAQFSQDEADELVDLQTLGKYKTLKDFQSSVSMDLSKFQTPGQMQQATDATTGALESALSGRIVVHKDK